MSYSSTVWARLEERSPATFLTAAGLFAFLLVAHGFKTLTGSGGLSPVTVFACLLVVFVGVLGLYPRLSEQESTLATGGVGLLAVTAAIILSTLGLTALPIELSVGKPTIVAIIVSVTVGSTLGLATFGVASLRTGGHLRPVGGFLLVMAAGTSFVTVSMLVYSNPNPAWVGFVVNGLFATSLGSIGFVLRTEDVPTDHTDPTGDVAAD